VIDPGRELKRGILWFGSATLLMRLLDLGATLVLLQVLTRQEMGLAALSWSVVVVCEAFSGLGVGSAFVQAREVSRREMDSLFWFTSIVGIGLALLTAALADVIAGFYGEPVLRLRIVVSACKLMFVGVAVVPLQRLARELRFREAGVAQTGATALEAITKVALALSGAGAWALVISNAARGLFVLVVVYALAPYWPRLHFKFGEVRSFLAFGLRTMTSGAIFHAYRNADYFFVGRYLGLEVLGLYRVAFSLAMTPLEVGITVVNRVTFPVYSRIAGDSRMLADAFARSLRYVLLLIGPIVVLSFFAAEDVVAIVAHERWLPAVPAIQVLCWAALLRGVALLFPPLFQAAGRPEYGVYDALLSLGILVGGFLCMLELFAHSLGMIAVCIVWVAAYPLLLCVDLLWARRATGLRGGRLVTTSLPVLGGLVAMAAPLTLVSLLRSHGLGPLAMLATIVGVGIVAYGLYLRFVLRLRWGDLRTGAVERQTQP
jgi:O-antigen/teichoic acid export membrane protein